MKLSKLYCNKEFHNISFITDKGGVNVIVGDSVGNKQHNLGKSKLAELLNFMLLKKVDNKFFFYTEEAKIKFADYEFYLEILLNNGQYVTIKRAVITPTKVAFKLHEKASVDYIYYECFDELLPFEKAQTFLNELLDFKFCKDNNESYRRLVSYSLRTQGDYEPKANTIFQLRKFAKNKDRDWKPLLFSLLGFDGSLLTKKYNLEEEIAQGNKKIKDQEKDSGIKTEDKDSLVGKIQNIEADRDCLSTELENLDFYQQDKELIHNLVGDIELQIAELNTELYNLEYQIEKLNGSILNGFSFDLKKVTKLFDEVRLHFPENLAKDYEQLITFNHKITEERNTQIRQTLEEKIRLRKELNSKLRELNGQREKFRDLIQDTSLFKRYAVYQKKLVELERELARYQMQLESINKMENERALIEKNQKNMLHDVKEALASLLENTAKCDRYMNIRKEFSHIVRQILDEHALITIKANSNTNIEFKTDFPDSAKADGNTYYKILCVAFDLAILINYRSESYFRFVYHDDVISGDDNGVKSRLIEVVKEIAATHDVQYIFSAIKDNFPATPDLSENIILSLHNKNDNGKLFKMGF